MTDAMPDIKPDRAQIVTHLERQTARWGELDEPCWLEIRMLRSGGDESPLVLHTAVDADSLGKMADDIIYWNNKGRNVYTVRNPVHQNCMGAAKDSDILAAFACFADCDDEASAIALRDFVGPKYSYAVTTGTVPCPRPHPYWELAEPTRDLAAWTDMQKRIAARLGSDRTVVNPSRIMRVAGTVTWPDAKKRDRGYVSELATIRTTYPEERRPVPLEQMERAFPEISPAAPVMPASGARIDMGLPHESVDREAARDAALAGDGWHNNMIRIVASYVGKGLSDGEIHAITDAMTLPGYTLDQTRAEVQTAINGARAKGWTPQEYADATAIHAVGQDSNSQDVKPFIVTKRTHDVTKPAHDVTNFDTPPRPVDLEWFDDIEPAQSDSYVVKGVLGDGAMSLIYGASNSGKTFFALDLAYHIAIDAPWRTHRVRGGGVLYLAAEGGRGMINRVAALRRTHGVCDVPLAVKRAGLDLLKSTADLQHIVDLAGEVAKRAPLRVIVIDTLSRVMAGGDENSAQDMTALIRNIDAIRAATGAHIVLVHHSGKDAAKGARGHSSLRAATDTEIEVTHEEGDRVATVTKQRDYQGGESFAFGLKSVELGQDQDGDEVVSCVVEMADSEAVMERRNRTSGLGGNQKIVADCFDLLVSDGAAFPNPGGTGFPESGKFWCVDYDRLRALAAGKFTAKDPSKAFKQAFDALTQDRGLFCMTEKCVWRVDRRKS